MYFCNSGDGDGMGTILREWGADGDVENGDGDSNDGDGVRMVTRTWGWGGNGDETHYHVTL